MIQFQPSHFFNRIVIVGCGGTGSRLVPLVAQFIRTIPYVIDPQIYLIDGDEVEEKNLSRQNFISTDVGKNKANVLAARYSRAYGIPIIPIPQFINKDSLQDEMRSGKPEEEMIIRPMIQDLSRKNVLLILCVDSVEARKDIFFNSRTIFGTNNMMVIDAGNENDFGQVKLTSTFSTGRLSDTVNVWKGAPEKFLVDLNINYYPADIAYFADMQAPEVAASCADLDQTMAINSLVANTIFSIVQNIYYAKPMMFHRLNISLGHGITPEYLSTRYFQEVSQRTWEIEKDYYSKEKAIISGLNYNLEQTEYDIVAKGIKANDKLLKEMMKSAEKKKEATEGDAPVKSRKKAVKVEQTTPPPVEEDEEDFDSIF